MSIVAKKSYWIPAVVIGLVFIGLLAVRLDLPGKFAPLEEDIPIKSPGAVKNRDSWQNIFQNNRKIGYSHSVFFTGHPDGVPEGSRGEVPGAGDQLLLRPLVAEAEIENYLADKDVTDAKASKSYQLKLFGNIVQHECQHD